MKSVNEYPMITSRDADNNVAYLAFASLKPGGSAYSLTAQDADGETALVLDFGHDGELLGIEMLNAERQMPRLYRI
ncbi:DUF2283 domain-containing protein [Pseudonocardia spinosispora]|uniref:DUF2283 domain-containing protein n=1 Tax=Pseudonocardia spinosispora TaxID=103441 RepID=UPI00146F94FC|nr:DUF2283 domain-containing protein [Pseudonocardia spinosispora]